MKLSKKIIITILIIAEIFCVHSMYKSYNNKNVQENIKKTVKNKKQFAIKVQNDTGNYEDRSTFPGTGYYINELMTSCVDQNGEPVTSVNISSDGTNATVTSKYTAYCTLFFSKCKGPSETILAGKSGLSSCPVGGMYRYQGASVNNYICFGTNNKNTCIGNPDKYMYRIIGVTPDNHLKIMKETDIGEIYWTNTATDYIYQQSFYGSNLYNSINGGSFLTNNTYIPSGWSNKIYSYTYYYGYSNDFGTNTIDNIYKIETGKLTSMSVVSEPGTGKPVLGAGPFWKENTFKIALLYVHDYLYSIANNTSNCTSSGSCSNSWMKYSKNYITMSLCGYNLSTSSPTPCGIYYISSAGSVVNSGPIPQMYTTDLFNIKPTFYLTNDITLSNSLGSITDPLLITNVSGGGTGGTTEKLSCTINRINLSELGPAGGTRFTMVTTGDVVAQNIVGSTVRQNTTFGKCGKCEPPSIYNSKTYVDLNLTSGGNNLEIYTPCVCGTVKDSAGNTATCTDGDYIVAV